MGRPGRLVVDTDVLIDFFAGAAPAAEAVAHLIRNYTLSLTTLTLFELASGARARAQLDDIELLVQTVDPLPLNVPAALRAGALYRDLKRQGRLLAPTDLLIAGCCLAHGLPLFSRNVQHFARVEGLTLLDAQDVLAR